MGCEWGHGSGHTLQVKRTRNPSDIERSSPGRVLSWPSSPAPSVGSASAASPDKCPIPIHSERHSPVSLREKPGMRMNLLPRQGVSSEIIHPDSYPPPHQCLFIARPSSEHDLGGSTLGGNRHPGILLPSPFASQRHGQETTAEEPVALAPRLGHGGNCLTSGTLRTRELELAERRPPYLIACNEINASKSDAEEQCQQEEAGAREFLLRHSVTGARAEGQLLIAE